MIHCFFFFFKQKTAYEMRISDWSSDVCSSDLRRGNEIGRDGKADADRAAGLGEDRRIDAGELAVHGDQRAAGIARIDRRIGLDIGLRIEVAEDRKSVV